MNGRPIDLEEMRVLLALAEHGTLLRAARALKTSRARLRRRLAELEQRAGAVLLAREAGALRPTPAGEVVIRGARRLFEDAELLLTTAREVAQEPTGVLRVALQVGFPDQPLALIWKMLRERYPKLRLDVRISETPLAFVPEQADVAFCIDDPHEDERFEPILVWRLYRTLMASREYLRRHGEPNCLEDLQQHDIHTWRHPQAHGDRLQLSDGGSYPIQPIITCSSDRMLCVLASDGQGIAYVPDPRLPESLWPDLVPVLPGLVSSPVDLMGYVPHTLKEVPRVQILAEMAGKAMGRLRPEAAYAPGDHSTTSKNSR